MEIPDCMLVVAEENCYNRLGDCKSRSFAITYYTIIKKEKLIYEQTWNFYCGWL